jgi:hypothetical protein
VSAVDRPHGFTRVDDDARPSLWVETLDKVHQEPFYRAYKERVRAILAPRASVFISTWVRGSVPMLSGSRRGSSASIDP